ncbi:creatinine amidohydrolase [Frankia sp. EI5c]|uniref:mycofactocin biosynthesis peptidyl-dipeptidase MftE n=1 Tax=Frankia sp. EI5c TaxID=683316 RepID=UPI0007C2B623|nr:mycofactocin biosynthesis peptidyl-dipeptidase MftE [Frankia sp. EI5c]OAA26830.1 creatinine amidohydrolase [Frankia sp. EI5c]
MTLAGRSWTGVPRSPLVLVPVGSCEQHGPHLPLTTDTTIAVAVADGVAERLLRDNPAAPVLVAPPITHTASGEHQGFPGTMSIGAPVLRLVLVELVRSMAGWCGRVVFVNGHGGNLRSLAEAVTQLREERHDVAWVPCEPSSGGEGEGADGPTDGPADAHAGFTETSLMLHLAPRAVDMDRAVVGNTAPLAELLPAIVAGGVAAVAPSGVLGDPTAANAPAGERILHRMIGEISQLIEGGTADAHGRLRGAVTAGSAP